jgi:hypothetical protein
MIPYFEELGQAVDAAWSAAGREPSRLPRLAADALRARPVPGHLGLGDVLTWVATTRPEVFPRQGDLPATFGDPPITVWHRDDFRIDVNVWATSTTAIHQHGFAGAFQVLHGSSLHSRYTFVERRRVSEHLRVGELSLRRMEVLRVGDVAEIAPGPAFVHALFHLDHPSATVVVRTHGDVAFQPQLNHDPPGVAYDTSLNTIFDELDHRRLQLLSLVGSIDVDGTDALLEHLFRQADPLWAYHTLASTLPSALATRGMDFPALEAVVDRWFDVVPWPDAELRAILRDAARHRVRRWDAGSRRALLTDARDRLIAAVLVNAPDRASIEDFLRAELPGQPPVDTLVAFIDRAYQVRDAFRPDVSALGVHDSAVGILREMVAEDLDFDGVLATIARHNPESDLGPQLELLRARDRQLRGFGLFAAWFGGLL